MDSISYLEASTQAKPYVAGLRTTATGKNVCYGALISAQWVVTANCKQTYTFRFEYKTAQGVRMGTYEPTMKYITIGSRHDAGQHDDDGGETIKITKSVAHMYYYQPGNAIALHKLETSSSHTPVPLPAAQPVTVHADEVFKTMGWTGTGDSAVITERNVTIVGPKVCVQQNLLIFNHPFCVLPWTAKTGCNILPGSPLVAKEAGRDVLVGLMNKGNACGTSGVAVLYNTFDTTRSWIKKETGV